MRGFKTTFNTLAGFEFEQRQIDEEATFIKRLLKGTPMAPTDDAKNKKTGPAEEEISLVASMLRFSSGSRHDKMKMLLDSDADPKTMLSVLQTYESVMGTGTAADLMASVAPSRSKIIPSMSSVFNTGLWFGSENALQEKMMKFLISEGDEKSEEMF